MRGILYLLKIASDKYQDDEGYVNISSAGTFIKRAKPDFDVRTFGYVKLPDLIGAFPEKYEMKRYPGKGTVTIVAYKCKSNGNILATENQQARINDVIEVKTGVYLHKT